MRDNEILPAEIQRRHQSIAPLSPYEMINLSGSIGAHVAQSQSANCHFDS
jgi:hypothetical protein